jgi:hypothetical protein
MTAVARKALELNLLDVGKAKSLYDKYTESVDTNIPKIKIPGLALLGSQVGVDNLRMVSMAPATTPCGNCDASVLLFNPAIVEQLKSQVFGNSLVNEENATVEVLNGTVVPGLAGSLKDYMQTKGFTALQVQVDEFADGLLYDNTLIVDVNGTKTNTTRQLAEWLNLSQSSIITGFDPQAEPFLDTTADVVVILGADTEVPTATFFGG